ncbi:hypothetical protein JZ751_009046 [Albula glossodonta]|uniref:Laminin N-terminal domain-containing protein n=1 Tax=Albula glossodonta TaxID=121402 RepID=A0A8T2P2C8_9TELE|nr:hypothetical protein JZ751_009046 [Albula glossodonta]
MGSQIRRLQDWLLSGALPNRTGCCQELCPTGLASLRSSVQQDWLLSGALPNRTGCSQELCPPGLAALRSSAQQDWLLSGALPNRTGSSQELCPTGLAAVRSSAQQDWQLSGALPSYPGESMVALVHSQDECDVTSCHPQLGDLMVGRSGQLSATSTCGLDGPQKYCILGYLEDEQKCFICDSRLPYRRVNNPDSHQIENVITTFDPERKMKWWQSENGLHYVSIRLDLESLFQFSHLVLTFKSFRPASMLVERSKDNGRSWKVFRYFAENCKTSFPGVSEGPADSVDDVICDSRYSGAEPSTDGEVPWFL